MGGYGSGRWNRWGTKTRVEQCLPLAVRDVRKWLGSFCQGQLKWPLGGGDANVVDYVFDVNSHTPLMILEYGFRDERNPVRLRVNFESMPMRFGRPRWWFICPLTVNGRRCGRRVGKLYLPPRERLWGCRTCHDLTYKSSQTAHEGERFLDGFGTGVDRLLKRYGDGGSGTVPAHVAVKKR